MRKCANHDTWDAHISRSLTCIAAALKDEHCEMHKGRRRLAVFQYCAAQLMGLRMQHSSINPHTTNQVTRNCF